MRYFFRGKTLFIRGDFRAASTGVNGGLRRVTTIINHTVGRDLDHADPLRPLDEVAAGMGFSRDFFGLLTAVDIRHCCILHHDFITLFVTAGVTNPNPVPGTPGTVNIIVHSGEGLTDGALLEALTT
ncbi:MAG TPA: adenosylcobinamide amidohydrolase, partial [Methanomicrobiales archaeon]|nr:adenosylcobinamide amidohydrolase [Methanomicrobiales archaeon]